MKKTVILLTAAFLGTSLMSCQSSPEASAQNTELTVFAAASMTETISKIADIYTEAHPNVTITCTFDSSGTLATQLPRERTVTYLFPLPLNRMNQIDINGGEDNTDGADFVLEESRIDLLENKVVLVTAQGSDSGIPPLRL